MRSATCIGLIISKRICFDQIIALYADDAVNYLCGVMNDAALAGKVMNLQRREFLKLAVGAAAVPALSNVASAEAYPTRPLRWVVPYAPGSGLDIVVRLLGEWLSER